MSPEQNPPQLRWRELSNAELEREYSPSSAIGGDFSQYVEAYIARSEAARTQCFNAGSTLIELRYGSDVSQSVDLVVPAAGVGPVPLLVFIHGGYWQLLSKRESFFAATACLDQGIAFAAVDYTLAPTASLDEIVNECRRALRLLGESATEYGYDQHRIFIAGSSAGAHLTAMAGLTSNESSTTTLGFAPAGLILISGVFELEPLLGTTINDAVGLDLAGAIRNSPMLGDLEGLPPTLLTWGEIETDEFKRQSGLMAHNLNKAGVETSSLEIPGRNHFDIVLDMADPQTLLGEAVASLIADTTNHI